MEGAKTDISVLNPLIPENREGFVIAAFLIIVAIIGKVITEFTILGQPETNRLAIGLGMITRGEVGLVFAGVGLSEQRLIQATGSSHHCQGDFGNVCSTIYAARCV